jgi:Tfp pilus assembly protein PilX
MMHNHNVIINNRLVHSRHRQRGVTLLITLIVLVAMMLAAIGMMRSIDTTTLIAGNVAFRQTTLQAGEGGIGKATSLLLQEANLDKTLLYTDNSFAGYMSHPVYDCEVDGTCVSTAAKGWWDNNVTFPVDNWSGATSFDVMDGSGSKLATVYYLIQRMCTVAFNGLSPNDTPAAAPAKCQTFAESTTGGGSGGSMTSGGTHFINYSVFYRITAKSVGPRNTVTYSQSLVLVPE